MIGPAPGIQHNWDWRAAGNFIGGGAGSGLLVGAAGLAVAGHPFAPFVLAALALIGAGLCCVWWEIGRPWRFLHVFLNPGTSWMTREAVVAVLLFGLGLLAALLNSAMLVSVAAGLALAFLYCQAMILRAAKGIPAWREPTVVPLVIATGLAEGLGLLLAGLPLLIPVPGVLLVALIVLLAVRFAIWEAYRGRLAAGRAPRRAVGALAGNARPFLLVGLILPTLLALAALVIPAMAGIAATAAGLCAAAAGAWLKFVVVTQAAHTQGFAIEQTPVRGAGAPESGAQPGWH